MVLPKVKVSRVLLNVMVFMVWVKQSHGQHDRQRAPGSIGNSSDA